MAAHSACPSRVLWTHSDSEPAAEPGVHSPKHPWDRDNVEQTPFDTIRVGTEAADPGAFSLRPLQNRYLLRGLSIEERLLSLSSRCIHLK